MQMNLARNKWRVFFLPPDSVTGNYQSQYQHYGTTHLDLPFLGFNIYYYIGLTIAASTKPF